VEVVQSASDMELTTSELQQQLQDIQCEMDKRTERAAKYKRLYFEEKKKCDEVTAQLNTVSEVQSCVKM